MRATRAFASVTTVLLSAGAAEGPTCRSPYTWPFNSTSIWNTALGSAAVFGATGLYPDDGSNRSAFFEFRYDDMSFIKALPSDPVVDWHGQGHWGQPYTRDAYCNITGEVVGQIHVPADYVWCAPGENNAGAFLLPDGQTVLEVQPVYVCEPGAPVLALVPPRGQNTSNLVKDGGAMGGHGGSGLSAIGGAIRLGEMLPTAAPIAHAVQIEFYAHLFYFLPPDGNRSECYSWPADTCDGYAFAPCSKDPGCYGGATRAMRPGALLAVPPADAPTVRARLATAPASRLLDAMSTYGAYVVDDTYWNASQMATEVGVAAEFATAYGFNWTVTAQAAQPQQALWYADLLALFRALRVVLNNAPGRQGGGGTPLAPPPPPFCAESEW